jgi:hypothetical protein
VRAQCPIALNLFARTHFKVAEERQLDQLRQHRLQLVLDELLGRVKPALAAGDLHGRDVAVVVMGACTRARMQRALEQHAWSSMRQALVPAAERWYRSVTIAPCKTHGDTNNGHRKARHGSSAMPPLVISCLRPLRQLAEAAEMVASRITSRITPTPSVTRPCMHAQQITCKKERSLLPPSR